MRALFPRVPPYMWAMAEFAWQCARLLAQATLALLVAVGILAAGYGVIYGYAVPPGAIAWVIIMLVFLVAAMVAGGSIARSGWWMKK